MVRFGARAPTIPERYSKVNVYGSAVRERGIEFTPLSTGEGERLWFRHLSAWLVGRVVSH